MAFNNVQNFGSQQQQYRSYPNQSPAPVQAQDEQLRSTACTPVMSNYNQRLQSFTGWSRQIRATPREIAEAGFFYIKNTRDDTKCFYCNGGLRNWEYNDDPWLEHEKWYPHCRYVNIVKGAAVRQITMPQARGYDIPPPCHSTAQQIPTISNSPLVSADDCPHAPPNVSEIMSSNTINSVRDFGYESGIVESAVRIAISSGHNFRSVHDMVELCMEIEDDGIDKVQSKYQSTEQHATETTVIQHHPPEVALADANSRPVQGDNAINSSHGMDVPPSAPSALFSETEKYKEMQDDKICKVCLTNERNCFFLPCGHLCCCIDCSSALKTCPLCRVTLTEIRRVYF